MKKLLFLIAFMFFFYPLTSVAQQDFQTDVISTSQGNLTITFIGHGTLMFEFAGKVIHVDPWSRLADYSKLPKADIILITHHHRDHLDPKAIGAISGRDTVLVLTGTCAQRLGKGGVVMKNGDTRRIGDLEIEAVPAYNLVHMRSPAQPYHTKGEGNGYIISFGDKKVYVAGDTENIPEMKTLKGIDIAFLPMNLPYTMTPEMVADAVKAFRPKVLYPYHYGKTDPSKIVQLLRDERGIEVRVRKMM